MCRRACEKKKPSLNFMSLVGFYAYKMYMFFQKFTAEQVLKSFLGRNNSLKPPFSDFVIVFHLVLKN